MKENSNFLLDTSAWIEFFKGSRKGRKVAKTLKEVNTFTCIITIAELTNWCFRNNSEKKIKTYVNAVKIGSQVIDVDENIMLLAGKMNYERKKSTAKWGMMDSIILSTSEIYDLTVVTTDSQFSDVEKTIIL